MFSMITPEFQPHINRRNCKRWRLQADVCKSSPNKGEKTCLLHPNNQLHISSETLYKQKQSLWSRMASFLSWKLSLLKWTWRQHLTVSRWLGQWHHDTWPEAVLSPFSIMVESDRSRHSPSYNAGTWATEIKPCTVEFVRLGCAILTMMSNIGIHHCNTLDHCEKHAMSTLR